MTQNTATYSTKPISGKDRDSVKAFLQLAQDRFKLAAEAESEMRREALDDFHFRVGEQWPGDIKNQRNAESRPCLTINRLPTFIRQITNEQRQQRPAIQVNPVGDGADVDTAEVFSGIIRHIEVNSDAEVAYDTAFDHMVTGGFGYWRIVTEYLPGITFNQEIKIKRVKNPFLVYMDPAAIEPDYSDARFCFVIEDIPVEDYDSKYAGEGFASASDFQSIGDGSPDWINKEFIRIAEYFYVEENTQTLVKLADGRILRLEDAPEGSQIEQRREMTRRKVKWAKINALEVLDEREWVGQWIPIVKVVGDELDIDGKRYLSGLVRNSKDPQRMYNYWVSELTQTMALAPKAPFVAAAGQIENYKAQWEQANTRTQAYLPYDPLANVPPPQRQIYEPPVQAASLMLKLADNDLKATTGIYDASLGQRGPDESGKAILARQKQTDVSTLNYSDNLARSIRYTGRILVDLIPKIYDAERIQRIIKPDQTTDHVRVFNSQADSVSEPSQQVQ